MYEPDKSTQCFNLWFALFSLIGAGGVFWLLIWSLLNLIKGGN
jgi:hypothetical protein